MAWKRILISLLNSGYLYSMLKSHCCADFLIIHIYIYIYIYINISIILANNIAFGTLKSQNSPYLAVRERHISKLFTEIFENGVVWVKRPRVPFKTNPGTVNHRAFRPIPKQPFFKAGLPAVLLYCSMAWFGAFYYHGYCHKSRGQSERHGTRANLNEPGSDSCVWEVYRQ